MIGRAHAADVFGIDGYVITVEAAIGPGLPGLTIVGESEGRPLHRAGLRARAALEGCCRLPVLQREIVNLAPGERRKDGTGVDLAIACALLVCYGVIPAASLAGVLLWGELAPDGSVLPGVGTLIVADTARRSGFRVLVLASSCAGEAAPIVGLDVLPVSDLSELIGHLRGEAVIACGAARVDEREELAVEFADVRDPLARLALEVMVAGGHHLLVHGPRGSGKTTLTRAVAGLLGELGDDEALELAKIHCVRSPTGLVRVPRVCMPSPRVSTVELLGGGAPPRPGEVSLAHRGVLVLDDLSEFSRECLDGVCRALEDGEVTVAGARFPAWFRLLATMDHDRGGLPRLSEVLLDRMDLVVPLGGPASAELAGWPVVGVRDRIALARERQRERLVSSPWASNAEIPASGPVVEQLCPLTPAAEGVLAELGRGGLDLRGVRRLRRVARTVADLDAARGVVEIDADVLKLAFAIRSLPSVGR